MWLRSRSSYMGNGILLLLGVWSCLCGGDVGVMGGSSPSTLEKREMPGIMGPMPNAMGMSGIGNGPLSGPYGGQPPMGMGPYGGQPPMGPYGGGPPQGAPPVAPYSGGYEPPYPGPPAVYGPQQPPYPPFGYKDPGFSVQTGFEGFLVPNSWYGLLPWGIEGVVIVIVGIIVAMVIVVSIVALLVWLTGFGDFALVKEQARSYLPTFSLFSMDYLNQVTASVMDALDRYNELIKEE